MLSLKLRPTKKPVWLDAGIRYYKQTRFLGHVLSPSLATLAGWFTSERFFLAESALDIPIGLGKINKNIASHLRAKLTYREVFKNNLRECVQLLEIDIPDGIDVLNKKTIISLEEKRRKVNEQKKKQEMIRKKEQSDRNMKIIILVIVIIFICLFMLLFCI